MLSTVYHKESIGFENPSQPPFAKGRDIETPFALRVRDRSGSETKGRSRKIPLAKGG